MKNVWSYRIAYLRVFIAQQILPKEFQVAVVPKLKSFVIEGEYTRE